MPEYIGEWYINTIPFHLGRSISSLDANLLYLNNITYQRRDSRIDQKGKALVAMHQGIAFNPRELPAYHFYWTHKYSLKEALEKVGFPEDLDESIKAAFIFTSVLELEKIQHKANYEELIAPALPLLCDGLLNSFDDPNNTLYESPIDQLYYWLTTKSLPSDSILKAQIYLQNLKTLWTQSGMETCIDAIADILSQIRNAQDETEIPPHLRRTWLKEQGELHTTGYIEAIETFADMYNRLKSPEPLRTEPTLWNEKKSFILPCHYAWTAITAIATAPVNIPQEDLDFLTNREELEHRKRNLIEQSLLEDRPDIHYFRYCSPPTIEQKKFINNTVQRNIQESFNTELTFSGCGVLNAPHLDPSLYPQYNLTAHDGDSEISEDFLMPIEQLRIVIRPWGIAAAIIHNKENHLTSLCYWTPQTDSIDFVLKGYNADVIRIILSGIWRDAHVIESRALLSTNPTNRPEPKDKKQKSPKQIVSLPRYQYIQWGNNEHRKAILEQAEQAKKRLHTVRSHKRKLPEGWQASEEQKALYEEMAGQVLEEGFTFIPQHNRGSGENISEAETKLYCRGLRRTMIALIHILGDHPE